MAPERSPYDILGIDHNASEDEIEEAYRVLTDKTESSDPEIKKQGTQETSEDVKRAYDIAIRRAVIGKKTLSEQFDEIRVLINENNLTEADLRLEIIDGPDRKGEWNFLYGCLMSQKGWFLDANMYFEAACAYEPSNTEYKEALDSMKKTVSSYKGSSIKKIKKNGYKDTHGSSCWEGICEGCGEGCAEGCCEGCCDGIDC